MMRNASGWMMRAALLCGVAFSVPVNATGETTKCIVITSVPTTITAPGVYCFTQNLTSAIASGNVITVGASDVTIDMNGFTLESLGSGDVHGIRADNRNNVVIRDGTIRRYAWGITLVGGTGHLVEDVSLDKNWMAGVNVVHIDGGVIRNNRLVQPGNYGIYLSSVSGCTVVNNDIVMSYSGHGIYLLNADNAIVEGNRVSRTSPPGAYTEGLECVNCAAKLRGNLVSPAVQTPYAIGTCVDAGNND